MRIATTHEVATNIKEFLQANIPILKSELLNESPEYQLPDIREYQIGFIDVFKLTFYPSIMIGIGKTLPETIFSDTFEVEVLFAHKNSNKEQLIKEGYIYSDLLYFLFRKTHRINNKTLNVEVLERDHFEGDEIFLSNITLRVEIEKGEYKNG